MSTTIVGTLQKWMNAWLLPFSIVQNIIMLSFENCQNYANSNTPLIKQPGFPCVIMVAEKLQRCVANVTLK